MWYMLVLLNEACSSCQREGLSKSPCDAEGRSFVGDNETIAGLYVPLPLLCVLCFQRVRVALFASVFVIGLSWI